MLYTPYRQLVAKSMNKTQDAGTQTELRFHTAASTFLVISVIFAVCMSGAILAGIGSPRGFRAVWLQMALLVVVWGALMAYYAILEVTVSGGVLRYRSLFGQERIRLHEVSRSVLKHDWNRRDPRQFFVITSNSGIEMLKFNIKPFRIDDIQRLLAVPELKFHKH